ncbi:MAG: nucleotide exchange factor GrpE [Flavobacteriaceae bacterium]
MAKKNTNPAPKTTAKKKSTKKPSGSATNDKIIELEQALGAEKEKYLRLFAEFENYKKRTSKERLELFKTANQEVITELIPVLDDFERAQEQAQKADKSAELEGFILIFNKFHEILKRQGLQLSAVEKGNVFDAEIHEAITQIPAPTDAEKGKIIDIVEKGYQLGDKIIRFPKVVVGQ